MMARREPSPHDPTEEKTIQDRQFYRVCRALILQGLPPDTDWESLSSEVREVVGGFVFITTALSNYKPEPPQDADEAAKRHHGISLALNQKAADKILLALLSGFDHPIFDFI